MKKLEDKIYRMLSEKYINAIIFLIGLAFIILGWALPNSILIGVGSSLVSGSIIAYISSIYIIKNGIRDETIKQWGLRSIYRTRQEMNITSDSYFKNSKEQFDIIGFGLRSLRHSMSKKIEEKIKRGVIFRFLIIHPESSFVVEREKIEDVTQGYIKGEIIQLYSWILNMKSIAKDPDTVQIKFYDTLPLDFYHRLDSHLFVGPYLYKKDSQQTISYEFEIGSEGFKYYSDYFEDLWDDKILKKVAFEAVKKID